MASESDKKLNLYSCSTVKNYESESQTGELLSFFWAQEYIGADLTVAEMKKIKGLKKIKYGDFEVIHPASLPKQNIDAELYKRALNNQSQLWERYIPSRENFNKLPVSVVPVADHGTLAMNLVFGEKTGVTEQIILTVTNDTRNTARSNGVFLMNQMLQKKIDLFSASLMIHRVDHVEALQRLRQEGVVSIVAAGNDYPLSTRQVGAEKYIIVGSYSPLGLVSSFSSSYPEVDIVAPSDYLIISKFNGKFEKFSGTSGARPLVTGAVANVMSLLPGITQKEIEIILKRTAIPVYGFESGLQGAGMVNAYKMFRVAKKMRHQWPKNRSLLKDENEIEQLLNFESEVLKLQNSLSKTVLKHCVEKKRLVNLRKAFLLAPHNSELVTRLRNLYQQIGLEINALFYESLLGVNGSLLNKMLSLKDPVIRLSAIRSVADLNQAQAIELLSKIRQTEDLKEITVLATALIDLGERDLAFSSLLDFFKKKVNEFGPKCVYEQSNWGECAEERNSKEEEALSILFYIKKNIDNSGAPKSFAPYCKMFDLGSNKRICEVRIVEH